MSYAELQAQLEESQRENRHLREQRDILKKHWAFSPPPQERYERVDAMKGQHSIQMLCQELAVSPSGYYLWRRRAGDPGPRAREDQALMEAVVTLHTASRQTYGSPRIVRDLRAQGRHHGRQRIARLMRGLP